MHCTTMLYSGAGVLLSAPTRALSVARCGGYLPNSSVSPFRRSNLPNSSASASCRIRNLARAVHVVASSRSYSSDGGDGRSKYSFGVPKDGFQIRSDAAGNKNKVRLSRLVASSGTNMQMSRRSAERMIRDGMVTVAGVSVLDPSELFSIEEALGTIKVGGRQLHLPSSTKKLSATSPGIATGGDCARLALNTNRNNSAMPNLQRHRTRIWLAHKLPGELVAENDPYGRQSLLDRLRRGGVGRPKKKGQTRVHLKPVGRLDMMTEGLLILTNDGSYAREMELPSNKFHRTYRARVHGRLTEPKMRAIRSGVTIDNTQYAGMDVKIEQTSARREQSTNIWIRITCSEGKNRQIRKVLEHLGLKVTRLIRTQYGDYSLNTIPPGMAIEVPVKALDMQKNKGQVVSPVGNNNKRKNRRASRSDGGSDDKASVRWVRHA